MNSFYHAFQIIWNKILSPRDKWNHFTAPKSHHHHHQCSDLQIKRNTKLPMPEFTQFYTNNNNNKKSIEDEVAHTSKRNFMSSGFPFFVVVFSCQIPPFYRRTLYIDSNCNWSELCIVFEKSKSFSHSAQKRIHIKWMCVCVCVSSINREKIAWRKVQNNYLAFNSSQACYIWWKTKEKKHHVFLFIFYSLYFFFFEELLLKIFRFYMPQKFDCNVSPRIFLRSFLLFFHHHHLFVWFRFVFVCTGALFKISAIQ